MLNLFLNLSSHPSDAVNSDCSSSPVADLREEAAGPPPYFGSKKKKWLMEKRPSKSKPPPPPPPWLGFWICHCSSLARLAFSCNIGSVTGMSLILGFWYHSHFASSIFCVSNDLARLESAFLFALSSCSISVLLAKRLNLRFATIKPLSNCSDASMLADRRRCTF